MTIINMGKIGENLIRAEAKLSAAEAMLLSELKLDSGDERKLEDLALHASGVKRALESFSENLTHLIGMVESSNLTSDT